MVKESNSQDRNFDDLAKRFKKNIYGGLKGDIRLAILERDFTDHIPIAPFAPFAPIGSESRPWRILDAGGGQGQFSLQMAKAGHEVVICDISTEMLKLAQDQVTLAGVEEKVQLIHCAIQDLPQQLTSSEQQFDLVICHAVMEWMQEPSELLSHLLAYLKPDGYLSLTFYNLHSLIYKNLLRTNFKKIVSQDFAGTKGSLTPINPLDPQQVMGWINNLPLKVLTQSGIRVFHDYIFNEIHRNREPEQLIQLELFFSKQEPYRSLGRYMHVLAQKQNS